MKGNNFDSFLLWNFKNFKTDLSTIENKIKKSDVLITDGTHRIVGLSYKREEFDAPLITLQCMRNEVAYVKQVAFNNGIKVVENARLSALLFRKYTVGNYIQKEEYSTVAQVYARLAKFKNKQ